MINKIFENTIYREKEYFCKKLIYAVIRDVNKKGLSNKR